MTRHLFAIAVLGFGLFACEENPGLQVIECADIETFPPVSNLLEKRCGTLDCHGSLARPLRLYGRDGLRLLSAEEIADSDLAQENNTVSGGKSTTDGEFTLNWRSLCGLEPEKMTAVQRGDLPASELMVLRKPLGAEIDGGERHKGGQLFNLGGEGYDCLENWIVEGEVTEDCTNATADL